MSKDKFFPDDVQAGDFIVPKADARISYLLPEKCEVIKRIHQVVLVLDQFGTDTCLTLRQFERFA